MIYIAPAFGKDGVHRDTLHGNCTGRLMQACEIAPKVMLLVTMCSDANFFFFCIS